MNDGIARALELTRRSNNLRALAAQRLGAGKTASHVLGLLAMNDAAIDALERAYDPRQLSLWESQR